MAGNYNLLVQMGNLTRDPELKYTPGGSPVTSFCIATNRKWKDRQGREQDEICYTDWECWGALAESVAKYCWKGSCVMAEGRLKLDRWQDRDGRQRSRLKGVADFVQFVSEPRSHRQDSQSSEGCDTEADIDAEITDEAIAAVDPSGDDVPF